MRDIAITLLILGLIPMILKYPWTGVLVFAWVSIFNPHRFAWGFAYDFQFVMIIGVATVVSMLLHWKEVRLPINSVTVLLMLLPFWMTVTLLFALEPSAAYLRWEEVMKTFFFVLVAASLLHSRKQLEAFLWVIVVSIGFYGIKGGIFTLLVGGGARVYGPPGTSFLRDNNSIAVAIIMIIPLMHFLGNTVSSKWIKLGMYGAMCLSGMAVLGSQSRGAFVGIVVMVGFLWLKSTKKLLSATVLLPVCVLSIGFMPQEWVSRMDSIGDYEQDMSAQGRLNAWRMAFNLANDRPLVGGGFVTDVPRIFEMYAPDPTDVRSAHSVYFQMLGEHGYVGLALFLSLAIASWMTARRTIKASRNSSDCAREADLARAIQVSLIGFASAGAFVNIAYWDFVYYEIVILMASYQTTLSAARKLGQGALEPKQNVAVA
jgi:probable O-glycosylation ligase (exosortase A-associated)